MSVAGHTLTREVSSLLLSVAILTDLGNTISQNTSDYVELFKGEKMPAARTGSANHQIHSVWSVKSVDKFT